MIGDANDIAVIDPMRDGEGSACGLAMDDRPYSSLGYEKVTNKLLQVGSKEEFIEEFGKMRIIPRYFKRMEVLNVKGADFVRNEVVLHTLSVDEVAEMKEVEEIYWYCRGKRSG